MSVDRDPFINICLENYDTHSEYITRSVYQYDHGLKLRISGLNTCKAVRTQYAFDGIKTAITTVPKRIENHWISDYPDVVIKQPNEIHIYVYIEDATSGMTVCHIRTPVIRRIKPSVNAFESASSLPPIEMYGGDTVPWEIELVRENGSYFSYDTAIECTFKMVFLPYSVDGQNGISYSDIDPVLQKYGTVVDNNGIALVEFRFATEDTRELWGKYLYQIEVIHEDDHRSMQGVVNIHQNLDR